MWIYQTEEEIARVVKSGALRETTSFDAKREIGKNEEVAKDIAAMANDGGILLYGIGEDEQGRPTILTPVKLEGVREKINSIALSSISEPLTVSISTIPTNNDPSVGYIVVQVPASPRAPHMVVVKGHNRYYGRTDTGNIQLSEGSVSQLYERRKRSEIDQNAMLDEEITASPLSPHNNFSYLYLVAHPTLRGDNLIERALSNEKVILRKQSMDELVEDLVFNALYIFDSSYTPDFVTAYRAHRLPEGYIMYLSFESESNERRAAYTLNLKIDLDGSGHLFCGKAGERPVGMKDMIINSELIAGLATRFFYVLGLLYSRASYIGSVETAVALTNLEGGFDQDDALSIDSYYKAYKRKEYRHTDRVLANTLIEDPRNPGRQLLMPFFASLTQNDKDPFPSELKNLEG